MLIRLLVLLALCIPHFGCNAEYGEGFYPFEMITLSDEGRRSLQRDKRELIQIEDLQIGDGPVAAWEGRRITADVEIRYADSSLVYKGPIRDYVGFSIFLYDAFKDDHQLANTHYGIQLGLNGMAVGGRRRLVVERRSVCTNLSEEVGPRASCFLIRPEPSGQGGLRVRKETLVVDATLTESCIPIHFRAIRAAGSYVIFKEIGCRDSETPKSILLSPCGESINPIHSV